MLREVETISAIDEASSADEAITLALRHLPNVVILDVNMPGKNGLSVLPSLRGLRSAPLVVVLTNDPTEHHRRSCLAGGAHFFFDKSKHFDSLLEVLRSAPPTPQG